MMLYLLKSQDNSFVGTVEYTGQIIKIYWYNITLCILVGYIYYQCYIIAINIVNDNIGTQKVAIHN